ncbi:MAG TPA: hypothetical protein DEQ47_16675 [Solibacterales bacterium]|nr:hypothetical protein [Bryobacterales bacterium]
MNEVDLGTRAFAWLMAAGALSGALSLWAFRRWCDTDKLRAASNVMLAHLMEFRLFTDEPVLILRAQRELLVANARLLRLILLPSLLLTAPFGVVLVAADAFFARAPLRPGEAAVITVQYAFRLPNVQLQAPPEIVVETPPVRARFRKQISWRVRPSRASSGKLRLRWNATVIDKSISASPGLHWVSEQRSGSLLGYLAHPRELPFSDRAIDWIRIQYPSANVLGFHWLVWYSTAACCGALLTTLGASRL